MSRLDTALKVVRLLGALVWLGVGLLTLVGTWIAFRELGPSLKILTAILQGTNPQGFERQLQNRFDFGQLQQYFPARGSTPAP